MKKGNSIVGGIIIMLAGIALLWWNEGDSVKNIQAVNEGMKNYTDIKSFKVNDKYDGKLVATHGKLIVNGEISDDEFGVTTNSAALSRKVEMYQWKEECDDDNCTYTKEWDDSLIDSSTFKETGYSNPESMPYESEKFVSDQATIGAFTLPEKLVKGLSTEHRIKDLSEETASNHSLTLSNNYYTNVIDGKAEVGNIRISFYDNNAKVISVLAMQIDDTFKTYKTKKGKDLFRIYEDNYNGYDMLMNISKQNNIIKWVLRLVGTLLVICGIGSLFAPLTLIMDNIPILGGLVNGATGLISFVLGLSISLLVIAIAWFRFRPLLSIVLIVVVVFLVICLKLYSKSKPAKEKTNTPTLEKPSENDTDEK